MALTIIPVDPFDLVVFGATGDLALRKLFLALYRRDADGQIPDDARIIGASLSKHSDEAFRNKVEDSLRQRLDEGELNEECLSRFLSRICYFSVDVTSMEPWTELSDYLEQYPDRIRVFYLSVAPTFFYAIAHGLQRSGLNEKGARLVVEKPFGRDQASAAELNEQLGEVFFNASFPVKGRNDLSTLIFSSRNASA